METTPLPPIEFPTRPYAGYLFDCDGTLINSMPLHWKGWQHAIKRHGDGFEFPHELYVSLAGTATGVIVGILNERFGLSMDPDTVVNSKREYYLANLDQLTTVEPVVAFAREVAATAPVAIVTGGNRGTILPALDATGIRDLFPVIVTYEDVENGKPAPDMFLLAAEKLNVPPSGCIVFEDGQLGIQGAHAAGMDTVFVPTEMR